MWFGLADTSCLCTEDPLYGKAEFRGGASEPEDKPTIPPIAQTTPVSNPSVSTPKPVSEVNETEYDTAAVGYSVLQKGFFFAAILGCIVVYLRINSKKDKRYSEKSMV